MVLTVAMFMLFSFIWSLLDIFARQASL